MFHPSTRALSSLRSGLPTLVLLLLVATPAAAQAPVPGQPGYVYLDDMIVPQWVTLTDANYVPDTWPNGVVPYVFAASVSTSQQASILKAMAEIEAVSQVSFVPVTSGPPLLLIRPSTSMTCSDDCSFASLGYPGGAGINTLDVGSNHWNSKYVIVHELFHTLAFTHEQQRIDRDSFITINGAAVSFTNCDGSCLPNFSIKFLSIAPTPYDFLSIMHYGQYAFSICPPSNCSSTPLPTISCKPQYASFQSQIGNRSYMTHNDAAGMAFAYGAPSAPGISSINPTGVTAGSSSFTLTIIGSHFFEGSPTSSGVQGSVVRLNGQPLQTTFIDKNTLTATVPASMIQSSGSTTITVLNDPTSAGGVSNGKTMYVNVAPCASEDDHRGWSVASLGDVNGDGSDDYLEGTPGYGNHAGRVRCRSGATGAIIWQKTGSSADQLGRAVASAGDVNSDGVQDALLGAPGYQSFKGRVHLVNGQTGAVFWTYVGPAAGAEYGESVADAGDIDNDGIPDAIIGAPGYSGGQGRIEVRTPTNGGLVFWAVLGNPNDRFGDRVAGGVDVNGDGRADFGASAPYNDTNGLNTGKVWVFSGNGGSTLFTRTGDTAWEYFGKGLAFLHSTSRGSVGEVAVGATQHGSGFGSGVGPGYVRRFRLGGFLFQTYQTVATHSGNSTGDHFGHFVGSTGDLDDDGIPDMLVGAPQRSVGAAGIYGPGRVQVLSGATGSTIYEQSTWAQGNGYGWCAAWADLDGDTRPQIVIGAPYDTVTCTGAGSVKTTTPILAPAHEKVLISEIFTGEPDGVEVTNFTSGNVYLSNWRIIWQSGSQRYLSFAFPSATSLAPGESMIIKEAGTPYAETPPGVQVHNGWFSIPTNTGDFSVALATPTGFIVDEVRVANTSNNHTTPPLGGRFRGLVLRHQSGPLYLPSRLERIWGLDSNSGTDWSAEITTSMGIENRSSGLYRGSDPIAVAAVKISEIDDSPDYVELQNQGLGLSLQGFYVLCSGVQGSPLVRIDPFPFTTTLAAGAFLVIGDTPTEPSEMPATTPYVALSTILGGNLPFTTSEYTCALYDSFGRVVDLVRTTGHDDTVAHNLPRPPALWSDFKGAAPRGSAGDAVIIRSPAANNDTGTQDDWHAASTRTMGASNGTPIWTPAGNPQLDVRLSATPLGGGISMILNAGPAFAGHKWSFLISAGHLQGQGPIAGLGSDAFANWLLFSQSPPWFGFLDSRGSGRFDTPCCLLPSGVATDNLFILQHPTTGALTLYTHIFEWDS